MYTESIGANNVPAFLSKLWRLVDSSQNNDLISWSLNGKSFIIRNQAKFAKELLPLYFKHNNMASFIRQLNMYGFRKITHIENSGLKVENDEIEFYHSCFVKGQENMLEYIKRKNSLSVAHAKSNGALEDKTNKEEVHLILTDVKGIKNKQDNMDTMLVNLQNENEALWKEIANLRHKHQKQQAIVERLIHFLMSLVQTGNIGLKRKVPLMIDSDKDGNKNISLSTIASNILNPDSGPIIQEITHGLLDDEYENDVNSPIINTALSDTSEPAQFDDANDSPIFCQTPSSSNLQNQQAIETNIGCDLKESTINNQAITTNLFDPLQESINAINAEDDQIIDLNEVGAIAVNSPITMSNMLTTGNTSNQAVENYQLNSPQPNIVSDQLPTITSTTQPTTNASSNKMKLAVQSQAPITTQNQNSIYVTNSCLVPTTSSVLNTPNITAEDFGDHLGGIDNKLVSLQDQLVYGNLNIDANTLMGLFSLDSPENAKGTSSDKVNSPLSTPKQIIQEEPNDLNSNFDLCDNYSAMTDTLFDSQPDFLESGLNDVDSSMIKQHGLNESIFNADDFTTDDDINRLLNLNNQSNQEDLFNKEKKRKRIS